MSKHTPGPWNTEFGETYTVRDVDGGRIAICTNLKGRHGLGGRRDGDEVAANASRIVACVNACEGWNPDAMLARANEAMEKGNRIMRLEAERDALLAALERICAAEARMGGNNAIAGLCDEARAVIASIKS